MLGAASRRVSYVRTGRGGGDVSVTVRFDEITFVSVEDNSCVSPLSYMEARRRGELDSSTTRSLDPQLERVELRGTEVERAVRRENPRSPSSPILRSA